MPERWEIWERLAVRIDLVLVEASARAARVDRMWDQRPETGRHLVAGAGHNLHLEQPQRWINLLGNLLGC